MACEYPVFLDAVPEGRRVSETVFRIEDYTRRRGGLKFFGLEIRCGDNTRYEYFRWFEGKSFGNKKPEYIRTTEIWKQLCAGWYMHIQDANDPNARSLMKVHGGVPIQRGPGSISPVNPPVVVKMDRFYTLEVWTTDPEAKCNISNTVQIYCLDGVAFTWMDAEGKAMKAELQELEPQNKRKPRPFVRTQWAPPRPKPKRHRRNLKRKRPQDDDDWKP